MSITSQSWIYICHFFVTVFYVRLACSAASLSNLKAIDNVFPEALHEQELEHFLLPNKRTGIDDCHLRFYKNGKIQDIFDSKNDRSKSAEKDDNENGNNNNDFPRDFAHVAVIGWRRRKRIDWECAGTLVTEIFVLASARCTTDSNGKPPDVVRLGDIDLYSKADNEFIQQFNIFEIFYHPRQKSDSIYFDLALLRLEGDVRLGRGQIAPACLWPDDEFPNFSVLESSGFSFSREGFILERTKMTPVPYKTCRNQYQKFDTDGLKEGITRDQFCLIDIDNRTCDGYSGGPVGLDLYASGKVTPFVVGMSSFGEGCDPDAPLVYTKVSAFRNWIKSVTGRRFEPIDCWFQYYDLRRSQKSSNVISDVDRIHWVVIDWNDRFSHFLDCGGTIIDYKYVLTSARCANDAGKKPQFVYFKDQYIKVAEVFMHPEYNGHHKNDVAILKLDEHLNKYKDAAPACLLKTSPVPFDEFEIASRAAVFDSLSLDPDDLAHMALKTISHPCAENVNETITAELPGVMCLLRPDPGLLSTTHLVPDSCDLYRGGAVERNLFRGSKYYPYVTGIISYQNDCGFEPVLSTPIAPYFDWIQSILLSETEIEIDKVGLNFQNLERLEGQTCKLTDGKLGLCAKDDDCLSWFRESESGGPELQYCYFQTSFRQKIFCCPVNHLRQEETVDISDEDDISLCPKRYQNGTYQYGDSYALLGWKQSDKNTRWYCSATLISPQYLVTTTTCAILKPDSIRFMEHDKVINAFKIIKHSRYDYSTKRNDIAMVKLSKAINLSEGITPICLWGKKTQTPFFMEYSRYPRKNKEVTLDTVLAIAAYNDACRYLVDQQLSDDQMCAEREMPEDDKSTSESGNHLVKYQKTNESEVEVPYLVGLSNWDDNKSIVLTRISSYVDWIRTNIKTNGEIDE